MKRVYSYATANPTNEESNKTLLEMAFKQKEMKEKFEEDIFEKWIIYYHNKIREKLKLPNKLFGFAISKDKTKAEIVLFDKDADGNFYEVFFDEEIGEPYILVDEEMEENKDENLS